MGKCGFGLTAALLLLVLPCYGSTGTAAHQAPPSPQTKSGASGTQATPPLTDEEKANQLSGQVQKLMVQCANMLATRDPLSLETCKRQRDLADQYPGRRLMVDRVLAHDEYGIALAVFDKKHEALAEFNQEIRLLPATLKPGAVEWSTAYWHRAMIYSQLGQLDHADRDYRAAEESFRRQQRTEGADGPSAKMRMVLRQHAALLRKEGRLAESQKLLEEAAQ